MKKLILLYVMFIMLLLVGCAAEQPMDSSFSYDSLDYDLSTMTFTNTYEYDILYRTGNSFDDFIILHRIITNESFTPSETTAYSELFTIMDILVVELDTNYSTIQGYNSSEFKDACDIYSISVTLADIVTFNAFKSVMAQMTETQSNLEDILSKIDYVEARLNRSLTPVELESLDFLQERYFDLGQYYEASFLYEYTFDDLLLAFKNQMSYVPSETETTALQSAYDIILSLIQ